MESELNIFSTEQLNKYYLPFILKDFSKKIVLKLGGLEKFSDFNGCHIDLEAITHWTEIKYWFKLIEYDLTCLHGCLSYLNYYSNQLNIELREQAILDNVEVFFFFDSSLIRYSTLLDRISQLVNCVYNLGLIQDKIGDKGVSFWNVIKELEKRGLEVVKKCIEKLKDSEIMNIRKVRNSSTHHYHPISKDEFLGYKIINNGVVNLDPIIPIKIREPNFIENLISNFHITENIIQELINIIVKDITVNVIHKDGFTELSFICEFDE